MKNTDESGLAGGVANLQETTLRLKKSTEELGGVAEKVSMVAGQAQIVYDSVIANHMRALELCAEIPLCRTITDFCAKHNKSSIAELNREEGAKLNKLMAALDMRVRDYTAVLLRAFNVEDADKLKGNDRKEFDASMRAFIEREDHYHP